MSKDRLVELGPVLGYCAVNTAGSWQLRDSAIQVDRDTFSNCLCIGSFGYKKYSILDF